MVIKTVRYIKKPISRHVDYLFRDYGNKPERDRLIVYNNIRNRSPEGVKEAFYANDELRKEKNREHRRKGYKLNTVHSYDEILAFSKKDHRYLSNNLDIVQDLSVEYALKRFGQDSLFVIVIHDDREHIHAHVYAHGTKYLSQQANRADNKLFKGVRLYIEDIQQERYPELDDKSVVFRDLDKAMKNKRKGRAKTASDTIRAEERGLVFDKKAMKEALADFYGTAKDRQDFYRLLEEHGVEVYHRTIRGESKPYGVVYGGSKKMRFSSAGIGEQELKGLDQRQAEAQKYKEHDDIINKYSRYRVRRDEPDRDKGMDRDLER